MVLKSFARNLCALLVVATCMACGGGGGSDGNDSSSSTNSCDVISHGGRKFSRIINGDSCSRQDSTIVSLRLFNFLGQEVALCSGTAISQTAVLTAAHCFSGGITGVIVETDHSSIGASSISIHPNFTSVDSNQLRDAAVVKVDEDLGTQTFPILSSRSVSPGEEVIIAGYGLDEDGGDGVLRAGTMRVSQVANTYISANFNGSGSNTCFGDSGGPLLALQGGSYALAGLTSSGISDSCEADDISTFTNLSSSRTLNFILSIAPDATTL